MAGHTVSGKQALCERRLLELPSGFYLRGVSSGFLGSLSICKSRPCVNGTYKAHETYPELVGCRTIDFE